ncbi:MAG: pyridoxal-phosphate dependent enzyme [bacterium]|nr:pyridoxal-phosphate dependent enzyme [Myxococcales bacterium]
MNTPLPDTAAVHAARDRIREWVRETPIIALKGPGARPIVLKLECLQRSGSFKLRGALNRLLALDPAQRKAGVITASGGNHGLGVAWAGWLLGIPVTVVAPTTSPRVKRQALVASNADLVLVEGGYPAADRLARERAERAGLIYIHAYDDPAVIAGQGTLVAEMIEQEPRIGTLVVAVGGGGLAAGATLAAAGRRVVGVEPEGCPTMHTALAAGGPVTLDRIASIAADSLGAGRAGELTYPLCRDGLDRVELVDDDALIAARQWLWDHVRVAAEHGAVAGLAALMQGRLDDDPGPIGVIICGANTDPAGLVETDDMETRPDVVPVEAHTLSRLPANAPLARRRTMFADSDSLFRALDEGATLDQNVDDDETES